MCSVLHIFHVVILFTTKKISTFEYKVFPAAAAAGAKSLQSCPTLCDPPGQESFKRNSIYHLKLG